MRPQNRPKNQRSVNYRVSFFFQDSFFKLLMSKRLFSQVTGEEAESNSKQTAIPLSKSQPELVNGIPLSGEDYLLVVR